MILITTTEGYQFIEDTFGKVTAARRLGPSSSQWERTFPEREYCRAPSRGQVIGGKVVSETNFWPSRDSEAPLLALRCRHDGDFFEIEGSLADNGLGFTVESMDFEAAAAFCRHLKEDGDDKLTPLAVRGHLELMAFGSDFLTEDPRRFMARFDAMVRGDIPVR